MTSLRDAAQHALEAWDQPHGINYVDFRPYMDAIRAALAEPNHDYERGFVEGMSEQARRSVDHAVNAMAERKPLTDEEIEFIYADTGYNDIQMFARAIEAAHGIKGEA